MKKKLKVIITESQFKRLIDNYDIKEVINESVPKLLMFFQKFKNN